MSRIVREGVPYTTVHLDWTCPRAGEHEVTTRLFPDSEGYVKGTKTIVTYEMDGRQMLLLGGGGALYAWTLPEAR